MPPKELGVKSDVTHDKPGHIASRFKFYDWLATTLSIPGIKAERHTSIDVACYHAGYTFVETLQAISTKYAQEQEGITMPVNFIRHYYDVCQLLSDQTVLSFIGTKLYSAHKAAGFRRGEEPNIKRPSYARALGKGVSTNPIALIQRVPELRCDSITNTRACSGALRVFSLCSGEPCKSMGHIHGTRDSRL